MSKLLVLEKQVRKLSLEKLILGNGCTTISRLSLDTHPKSFVTVTTYVVVSRGGVKTTPLNIPAGVQTYTPGSPDAITVVDSPIQSDWSGPASTIAGEAMIEIVNSVAGSNPASGVAPLAQW